MRGAAVYLEQPEFQAYLTAVFNGIWAEKLNMESPEVIADVLSKAGTEYVYLLKVYKVEK